MRRLPNGEELTDLIEGDVEPLGELGDVVGQERCVRGIRQRDARVKRAERFARQSRQDA